jgi:hypothetical protein
MKIVIIAIICIALTFVWYFRKKMPVQANLPSNSRLEINEQAFENMRAKTKWNLQEDMLWGFFFTNPTKEPLEPVARLLEGMDYTFVNIYLDDAKENWWLHVEKIETHTADSLTSREEELSEIAARENLGSYDGWDVGPIGR